MIRREFVKLTTGGLIALGGSVEESAARGAQRGQRARRLVTGSCRSCMLGS